MATAHFPITPTTSVSVTGYRVQHRLHGASTWDSFDTTGTTITLPGLLDNRLYDIQVITLSVPLGNPVSAIVQTAGINGVTGASTLSLIPLSFSTTSVGIGYVFNNLSQDITTFTVTLALNDTPGVILQTTVLYPSTFPQTLNGTFTSLLPLTSYRITVTAAIASFTQSFIYAGVTTQASTVCPNPSNSTAVLS